MYINIINLLMWTVIGLIVTIIGSIINKEDIFEFINRLCFTEVFQIIIFLTLSYFYILS